VGAIYGREGGGGGSGAGLGWGGLASMSSIQFSRQDKTPVVSDLMVVNLHIKGASRGPGRAGGIKRGLPDREQASHAATRHRNGSNLTPQR
jgi:hypothetical protein